MATLTTAERVNWVSVFEKLSQNAEYMMSRRRELSEIEKKKVGVDVNALLLVNTCQSHHVVGLSSPTSPSYNDAQPFTHKATTP